MVELFHKIVIIVAVVLFGISLTWFGVQIHSSKSNASSVYPPTFATRPDYWEIDENTYPKVPAKRNAPSIPLTDRNYDTWLESNANGTKVQFYQENKGYTPGFTPATTATPATVNFSDPLWNSYGTGVANRAIDCIYQEWANRVGVTWDGITNYTQC